jgi:hypothetical protein
MQGAGETRGFIVQELYEKIKDNERYGCTFGKVSREKIENTERCVQTLINNFDKFVALNTRQIQGQTYLTFAVILMALMTGGNLVWGILKAFKVLP